MNNQTLPPIHHWLPAFIAFVAATILGGCLVYDESYLYLYPPSESLNWLYANVMMGKTDMVLGSPFLACYQNINLLVTGLLIPAIWLHLPPYSALWLWQTVFNTLLIFRSAQWLHQKKHVQFTALSFALLYGNPLLWYALLLMPSQVIMAWLVTEWMLNRKHNPIAADVSVLVLSFCGNLGFAAALIICILSGIFVCCKTNQDHPSSLAVCASIIPAAMFYLIQSINAQTWFGAYLINSPSPLVDWLNFSWLTFQAHENLKFYLLWIGNGGAVWRTALPLFGILAITGLIQSFQKKPNRFQWYATCALVFFLLCLNIPSVRDDYTNAALLIILLLIPYTAVGAMVWTNSLPAFKTETAGVVVLVILLLGWFRQPITWQKQHVQAALLCDINRNIETVLETQLDEGNNRVTLPFHASLLASIRSGVEIIPLQMAIQNEFTTLDGNISGLRLQHTHALRLQPDLCFFYPENTLYHEQWENTLASLPHNQSILNTGYKRLRFKQLTYFKQTVSAATTTSLFSKPTADVSWYLASDTHEIKLHPNPVDPDRTVWDFEQNYSHLSNTGFAFGHKPNRQISAVGTGAAVSGTGEDRRLMGMLQSEPFVIHGDDLQFYANMPANASPTVFCLAVQQKIADRNPKSPAHVEHLFDHQVNAPLVGDTSYYIKPEELHYEADAIYGWKVVRVLHGGGQQGWQKIEWSILPWKGMQAVWLAADRDRQSWMAVDHIMQTDRTPGFYWDFESGTYVKWTVDGEAFGDAPAFQPLGEQLPVSGYEGSYFLNSYFDGSDTYTGTIQSPPFTITQNRLTFLVGGGNDINTVYVALEVNGKTVLRETGRQSESLRRVEWDIREWKNQAARITVVDDAEGAWGHILADDFRVME